MTRVWKLGGRLGPVEGLLHIGQIGIGQMQIVKMQIGQMVPILLRLGHETLRFEMLLNTQFESLDLNKV